MTKLGSPLDGETQYWITSVKTDKHRTAEEAIRNSVGHDHEWGLGGPKAPSRKSMKPGDWICFYAVDIGVVAHAPIASSPQQTSHPSMLDPTEGEWRFRLDSPALYLEKPLVIDEPLRARLEALDDTPPSANWGWLVLGSKRVTQHDFAILTGQERIEDSA